MALIGVTDRPVEDFFPTIGKINKGGAKGEKSIGQDLEYFRFTGKVDGAGPAFDAFYGEKPLAVSIVMPFDTADQCFQTGRSVNSANGKLLHICDGKTTVVLYDSKTRAYDHTPHPCPGGCKQFGRLKFFIPELVTQGYSGLVELETHSWNDIRSIWQTLCTVKARSGSLMGRQFILRRIKKRVRYLDNGVEKTVIKSLVILQPAGDWVNAQVSAALDEDKIDPYDEDGEGQDEGAEETTAPEGQAPSDKAPATEPSDKAPVEGNGNGKEKLTRPATPAAIREAVKRAIVYFASDAGKGKCEPLDHSTTNLLTTLITESQPAEDEDLRHGFADEVTEWLTGKPIALLNAPELTALMRWLCAHPSNAVQHVAVTDEVAAILRQIDDEAEAEASVEGDAERWDDEEAHGNEAPF